MATRREFYMDGVKSIPGHSMRRPDADYLADGLRHACVEWGFPVNEPAIQLAARQIQRAHASLYSSQGVARSQGRTPEKAEAAWRMRVLEALNAVGPFSTTPAIKVELDGRTNGILHRVRISGLGHEEVNL